jgi:hypothetical protein
VADRSVKQQFFEALMEKYGTPDRDRPKGFFLRIDQVTVYVMTIGRMTGKELALPEVSRRWPAVDRTASPDAQPSDAAWPRSRFCSKRQRSPVNLPSDVARIAGNDPKRGIGGVSAGRRIGAPRG